MTNIDWKGAFENFKVHFIAEMKLIARSKKAIQYFMVGVIFFPISFATLNNFLVFLLIMGISVGCIVAAHYTAKEIVEKKSFGGSPVLSPSSSYVS